MQDLDSYIRNTPLCRGLYGDGCMDHISRLGSTKPYTDQKFPNKYCAILVDYSTKSLYYDKVCESCRFKNEVIFAVKCMNDKEKYYFNPAESISTSAFFFKPNIDNFSMYSAKKYCEDYLAESDRRPVAKNPAKELPQSRSKQLYSEEIKSLMSSDKLEERGKRFKRKREDMTPEVPKINAKSKEDIEANIAFMEEMLESLKRRK